MDFQKNYLRFLLGFLGFTEIHELLIEPTLAAPEEVQQTESAAIAAAEQLAMQL